MKDIVDYILKNKYVIICVSVVVLLYALGIIKFLADLIILILLVSAAIFVGKKLQDNDKIFSKFFDFRGFKKDESVYYYQDKDEENKK